MYGAITQHQRAWRLILHSDEGREVARIEGSWEYVCLALRAVGLAAPPVARPGLAKDRDRGEGSFLRKKPTRGNTKGVR